MLPADPSAALPSLQPDGLTLTGVRKFYGKVEAIKRVDLAVSAGEFIVILGPSGCGKSTLLRMIAGLEDVSAGEIRIAGAVVTHLPPRKRECAMVFQSVALYPHMTVADNIGYPLRIARTPRAEKRSRVAEAGRVVGLEGYLDRKPSQLSGGQRQRVAMARAIVRKPKIFLFDEPLSNLDAKLRVQMRAEIRFFQQRLGTTSVFVTHDQVEAMTLADRIVVMNAGLIEQIGTPTEIYSRPANRYVASFVGAYPMSFLTATIAMDGQSVQIGGAGRLPVPGIFAEARRGGTVIVGLRSEGAKLALEPVEGALTGMLTFTEELGSHAIHHIDVAGTTVLVEGAANQRRLPGMIGIAVDSAQMHLFDAQSGMRIELVNDRMGDRP